MLGKILKICVNNLNEPEETMTDQDPLTKVKKRGKERVKERERRGVNKSEKTPYWTQYIKLLTLFFTSVTLHYDYDSSIDMIIY